jgi:signal peptidase I
MTEKFTPGETLEETSHIEPTKYSKKTEIKKSFLKELISFIELILIALVIIVPFKYFILEPFIVSGVSMSPSYSTGDYLIVNKLSVTVFNIERGDILVFVPPSQRSDS